MRSFHMSISRSLVPVLILFSSPMSSHAAGEIEFIITSDYLNIPVSHSDERVRMIMTCEGTDTMPVEVRLATSEPDYWVFRDISALKGKTMYINCAPENAGLYAIYQADTINGQSSIYSELQRPQYHFTTKRGWLNDPNGIVYLDGEYHLFYQHDPYDRDGVHKHWGHAVSSDLLHWQELPQAISPDNNGDIWSGTAVIDYANTSGFATGSNPVMIAAYTVDNGRTETQHIAFSNDRGRTFTKYTGNPVIASNEKWATIHTRDPKLLRYRDSHWVMVLCERDGHSIYTSDNLRDWTYRSHITGFWECPELFELPVDGNPENTLWVMYGASGTYMLGNFDGASFTPLSGKHKYTGGSIYAAQTFNNIPTSDGRRIQIGWGRINIPDAPFNQLMLLPTELTLANTKDGVRLLNRPVREIDSLCYPIDARTNITQQEAEDILNEYAHIDGLRIKLKIGLSHATDASLWYGGQRLIDYDLNGTTFNGHFYSPQNPVSMDINADIFIDRGVAEVFIDNGLFSDSMGLNPFIENAKFNLRGNNLEIYSLEILKVNSIWK